MADSVPQCSDSPGPQCRIHLLTVINRLHHPRVQVERGLGEEFDRPQSSGGARTHDLAAYECVYHLKPMRVVYRAVMPHPDGRR